MDVVILIVQTATMIAIVLTLIVYNRQLCVMRNSAKGQHFLSLLQYIQSEEVRSARKYVLGTLANKKFSKWTAEDCDKASTVCASYTTSGAMLKLGLIDKDMLEEWRLSVKTCFKICKPLIDKLRKIIGPEYWIEFEKLYNKLNQDRQSY